MLELRRFADADLALFSRWLAAPHVSPWFSDRDAWLAEVRARHGEFSFISHFIAEDGSRPVGFCQYYCCGLAGEADYAGFPPDSTFSLDYLIAEGADLRRGYGRAMLTALIGRIRAETAARLIAVRPESHNKASIGLLRAIGFTPHLGTDTLCLVLHP